jgi:hypothetical protein
MRDTHVHRTRHTALLRLASVLIVMLVSSPASGSAARMPLAASGSGPTPELAWATVSAPTSQFVFVPEFFDGGGSGPTAETAIEAAIGDAENTASGYGLFTCELVGEPEVFPRPPGSLRAFAAQVRLRCTA